MESNWRWNIPEYGMSGTTWRLAARLLPLETPYGFILADVGFPDSAGVYQLAPGQLPVHVYYVSKFGLPFPYGQNVEPD